MLLTVLLAVLATGKAKVEKWLKGLGW